MNLSRRYHSAHTTQYRDASRLCDISIIDIDIDIERDRQQDGRTDGQILHDGTGRASSLVRMQSRGKKWTRRENARRSVLFNISLSHSRSLKIIRNYTVEKSVFKFLLVRAVTKLMHNIIIVCDRAQ